MKRKRIWNESGPTGMRYMGQTTYNSIKLYYSMLYRSTTTLPPQIYQDALQEKHTRHHSIVLHRLIHIHTWITWKAPGEFPISQQTTSGLSEKSEFIQDR